MRLINLWAVASNRNGKGRTLNISAADCDALWLLRDMADLVTGESPYLGRKPSMLRDLHVGDTVDGQSCH